MSAFLQMIQAHPGWRVARVGEDKGEPHINYEPVIAWAETEDSPGKLVPILRDGWCEPTVRPLDGGDDAFLAILAPGESIDPLSNEWKANVEWVLRRQFQRATGGT